MSDWGTEVRARLEALHLSPRRIDDIADEIAAHIEDRYRVLREAGKTHDEAEAAAWREFESPQRLAWNVHHAEHPALTDLPATTERGHRAMGRIITDLQFAVRSVRRISGSTALAVVAFALGIGITTAVFSVFYGVLLKPLPYPDADRMVSVFDVQPACGTCPASYTKYDDWRTRNKVFEAMAGMNQTTGVVTGLGDAERVPLTRSTWTVPAVFKMPPMLGRWFTESEDAPGGPHVVVLGYQYWREHFGGASSVLDQKITIDGEPYSVIGVMPLDFQRASMMFKPLQMAPNPSLRGSHFLPVYARLKPGVTLATAQKEMVALGATLAKEFGHNHGIDVQSYPERVLGSMRVPLRMLMGAVSFVLLIACANIANLLLASGASRKREFAVRAAIGATKGDLIRQMLVESVALAMVGGVLGLVIAELAVTTFAKLADTIVPRASTISLDGTVLMFALGLSVFTGVFCALWPALRLNPNRLATAVRQGDVRAGTDAASRRFGHGLVVAEIALAFSLLAGSGLLIKNLLKLEDRPMGFSAEHVVAFDLPLAGARYKDNAPIEAFYDELLPQLRAIPGVEHAAATSHLPMYNFGWNGEVQIEGGNPWPANSAPLVERAWVSPDYFVTLAIPIRAGRAFDGRDREGSEPVAILTKSTADKFWPGKDPIGKRFSRSGGLGPNTVWTTVVGTVDDARSYGLQAKTPFQLYTPSQQEAFGAMTIVMRVAASDPSAAITAARQVVKGIDPSLPVAKVQTLESVVAKSVSQPRLLSALTALFGALAGVLAAVGVYGVMVYNVRRDRRQFGIRLALGADPGTVRRMIVMRGVTLGSIGVAIGGLIALWLTQLMSTQLSDVAPHDPVVFAATAAVLFSVAVCSCVIPAWQAGKTNPIEALRAD